MTRFTAIPMKKIRTAFDEKYGKGVWVSANEPFTKTIRKKNGYWDSTEGKLIVRLARFALATGFSVPLLARVFNLSNFQLQGAVGISVANEKYS